MKRNLFIFLMVLLSTAAWSQFSSATLSGGYSFANIENSENSASGFRINGLYEFNPNLGAVAHGFSVGYIGTSGEQTITVGGQTSTQELKINTWPIYYAPKYMFGKGSAKLFIKGALGMQFSGLKVTGAAGGDVTTNDAGFYGGAGAGLIKNFGETMFINLEYEWAYLSNSFYKDGFMNSVMLGVGKKW